MKIFLIDDEEIARLYLKETIEKVIHCAEVFVFSDQNKFLQAFKTISPDIVFLDVEMPEINGLELGQKLKKIKKNINIVYVTGYRDYSYAAWNLSASSYILKPINEEAVKNALLNLRYPIEDKNIVVKTFGFFDIKINNKSLTFTSSKSKELLAYLIDRDGSKVSRREMAAILFDDGQFSRANQKDLSRLAKKLTKDLNNHGIFDLFIDEKGYYVDITKFKCDLHDYLKGNNSIKYTGEYMEQYSWGEYRKSEFDILTYK